MVMSHFPSIWHGSFFEKMAYDEACSQDQWLQGLSVVATHVDDRLLGSRQPFDFPAYCAVCEQVRSMRLTWHFAASDAKGAVHPAWTEPVFVIGVV